VEAGAAVDFGEETGSSPRALDIVWTAVQVVAWMNY
jgi:hypothetical protein